MIKKTTEREREKEIAWGRKRIKIIHGYEVNSSKIKQEEVETLTYKE